MYHTLPNKGTFSDKKGETEGVLSFSQSVTKMGFNHHFGARLVRECVPI